jgi:dipeptidyl aminopeptidase/acylaminoacyl peptidase
VRWLLLALGVLGQGSGFPPFDVSALAVAPPMRVAALDMKTLKGEPRRLSWSPEGTALYLQTVDGLGPSAQARHYLIAIGGGEARTLEEEPDWAIEYWAYKVGESAPGFPDLKIDVRVDQQRTRVVPFAGAFVSGGGPSGTEAASTLMLARLTLSLLDVEIGQWMNDEPKSGSTFGWGPSGSGALVFVDKSGRVTLLDKERRQRPIASPRGALLPAWSGDGGYIAFLQKSSRTRYELLSIALARPDRALH